MGEKGKTMLWFHRMFKANAYIAQVYVHTCANAFE